MKRLEPKSSSLLQVWCLKLLLRCLEDLSTQKVSQKEFSDPEVCKQDKFMIADWCAETKWLGVGEGLVRRAGPSP